MNSLLKSNTLKNNAEAFDVFAEKCLSTARRRSIDGLSRSLRALRRAERARKRLSGRLQPVLFVIVGAALLGCGVIYMPTAKLLALFVGLFGLVAIFRWIELGIICVYILNASILYESVVPKPFTLGGMGFTFTEWLLIFMLFAVTIRSIIQRKIVFFSGPIALPLALFLLSAPLALAVAYYNHLLNRDYYWDFRTAYNTARPMLQYALFFVLASAIRTKQQLLRIIMAVMVIAIIVSILVVAQYFLGTSVKLFFGTEWAGPRIEALEGSESITRSMPPGQSLITLMFPLALCLYLVSQKRNRRFFGIACIFLGIGLVFGFSRSAWMSVLCVMPLIWLLMSSKLKLRLAAFYATFLAVVILGSIALGTLAPGSAGAKFTKATWERFLSMFQRSTLSNEGVKTRFIENRVARSKIRDNPIFGVGVGNPLIFRAGITKRGTFFIVPVYAIHNSHLEMRLVYGLYGVLCFAALSLMVVYTNLRICFRSRDPERRAFSVALFAAYIMCLIISFAAMTLLHQVYHITPIALILACTEVIRRLENESLEERRLVANIDTGLQIVRERVAS